MLATANITMQFGAKPLFEDVSVKFGNNNRYGLIGANGCGKSTFIKILGGDLEPSSGNVSKDPHERIGKLKQDQFAYETSAVIDTVIMGHDELWAVKSERDAIYAKAELSEADGMRAGDLESQFAEMDGYSAEARASELLAGVGIPVEQHYGLMSEVAPGWKLRVLLAQALFSEPDILLLDEPTNNLDINAIRWLEDILNERNCTMVIVSHDRHFLNSVCTHMADLDYGEVRIYPGSYDDYMTAATQVTESLQAENDQEKSDKSPNLKAFVSRFSANASKSKQATSRAKQLEKINLAEIKPSSRQNPFIRFDQDKKLHRLALEAQGLSKSFDEPLFKNLDLMIEVGERVAIIGPNGTGKTTLLKCLMNEINTTNGTIKWSEKCQYFLLPSR
jgi:ATPase components of ABC transporters with duplicated ATPase domains